MNSFRAIGRSASGIPLFGHFFNVESPVRILILGGVHGDEVEGVALARGFLNWVLSRADQESAGFLIVPELNPDGVLSKTRVNSNGVDLNRNLPTRDWSPKAFNDRYPPGPSAASEPENQALIHILEAFNPTLIVSLHSFTPILNVNGDCKREAEAISKITSAPISETIGYPTPGCLGTYAGIERSWPTLTYEIDRGWSHEQVLNVHLPALIAGVEEHKRIIRGKHEH